MIIVIIVVLLIMVIPCALSNSIYTITGGLYVENTDAMKRAYIMFMKAQDINDYVIEAESARDFWIADFMFSMANKQFAEGKGNDAVGFPLIPDKKMIKEIYKDIRIVGFDDENVLETKTNETINIINKEYPTNDIMKSLSTRVIVTDYAINLIQGMYPTNSKSDIVALLLRYGCMWTYKDGEKHGHNLRDIKISKALLSIPPDLYRFYNANLPNVIECFASPINHTLDRYCALYKDDEDFGAIGPFSKKLVKDNEGSSFIVNPPYDVITMDYVYDIISGYIHNNYTVCLPSKDGGLFHLYKGRTLHMKEGDHQVPMNPSIDKLLKVPTLSGILIIPSKVMNYWNFFKQRKDTVSYDTILYFYLKKEDINIDIISFIKKVRDIILAFGYGDNYGKQKKLYNIEEKKIMELYPETGKNIIESLKIEF